MGFFRKLFRRKPKNEKYEMGLHKTSEKLGNLAEVLKRYNKVDDNLFDELEDIFIQADMGVDTVLHFINEIKRDIVKKNIIDPKDLSEIIVDKMFETYLKGEVLQADLKYDDGKINIYLFVGVNGVGKTTSIGKIAKKFINDKKKVLIVAGDTFRAGAIEQLEIWAKRSGADFFRKDAGSDPSSVIHDALIMAKAKSYDVVLIDTAGRLQNKKNLMDELSKMHKVIEKNVVDGLKETLLVIDATTGQNGIMQAKVFKEITNVSGIILTKLDGSAKGGIVLAIRHEYSIPIKYIGLGEKIDDLVLFDIESYIYGLFKDFF